MKFSLLQKFKEKKGSLLSNLQQKNNGFLLNPKIFSIFVFICFLPFIFLFFSIHLKDQKVDQAKRKLSYLSLKLKSSANYAKNSKESLKKKLIKDPLEDLRSFAKDLIKTKMTKKRTSLSLFFKDKEKIKVFEEQKNENFTEIKTSNDVGMNENELLFFISKLENAFFKEDVKKNGPFLKKLLIEKDKTSAYNERYHCEICISEVEK